VLTAHHTVLVKIVFCCLLFLINKMFIITPKFFGYCMIICVILNPSFIVKKRPSNCVLTLTWAALRILLPVARATPAISEQFLQYLKNNPCTTRELKTFFNHYHQSNQKTRADMINTPEVFFKMIAENKLLKENKEQFQYLETQWQENLGIIYRVLKKLIRIVPDVFSSQQSLGERGILLEMLERVDNQMEVFKQTLHEVLNATSYNQK
jgi:hypothetical protein